MDRKINDFSFIKKYLKKEKITINFTEFNTQLRSHPNFPSLLSFHDAFSFFKIENIVSRLDLKDLEFLPNQFLALIYKDGERFLTYTQKEKNGFSCIINNKLTFLRHDEFIKIWDNIVLLVDKNENTNTRNSLHFYFKIFISLIFAFLFVSIFGLKFNSLFNDVFFLILILVGSFLSIEAMKQELDLKSDFSEKFCKSNSYNQSGCEKIIKFNKVKFFDFISLADLGVILFLGQLVSFFLFLISDIIYDFYYFNHLLLLVSSPILVFSIFYQWKIKKTWCFICLMISITIILELFFSFFLIKDDTIFSLKSIIIFFIGFLFIAFIWMWIKDILKDYIEFRASKVDNLRLRRDYSIFKYKLVTSKKIEYSSLKSFLTVGNKEAKLKLTLLTNPFCIHCAKIHKVITNIVENNNVLLNIRFNLDSKDVEEYKDVHYLHNQFCKIYFDNGEWEFLKALDEWYLSRDLESWFLKYGKSEINSEIIGKLQKQSELNHRNKLYFTPAILVGERLFPEIFDIKDIPYFIDELIEDSSFL